MLIVLMSGSEWYFRLVHRGQRGIQQQAESGKPEVLSFPPFVEILMLLRCILLGMVMQL
jgi:hypothetical protein